jgi:hypothetical protein|tara:strand:+ start:2200 stop:2544 length:345 start_codon:yes stop_codon:yes gene_type:complete
MSDKDYSQVSLVATRIQAHLTGKKFAFDPATLTLIVSLIINLVRLWWTCRSTQNTKSELRNPSLLFKLFLKREIRKQVKDKKQRKNMYNAFISVAPTLSEYELNNILKEIGGKR